MALVGIEVVFVGTAAVVVFVVVAVAVVVGEYMAAAFVELVVVAVVVAFVVKVACMASGDSTWVWVPSIVECMGMAWA